MKNYDFSQVAALCEQAIAAHTVPGIAIAIGDRNGPLYENVFGYARVFSDDAPCFDYPPKEIPATAIPVTKDTLFDMASCSKMFSTAMVALKYVETGKLHLEDKIGQYLDNVPEDKAEITVFRLMSHTAGLKSTFHLSDFPGAHDRVADTILEYPLDYAVGTQVQYSCMGYILLAKVLEKIGGARLDALAQQTVFDPLHMTRTFYRPLDRGETNIVVSEYKPELGRYLYGEVHDSNARFQDGVSGNAGLYTCLHDVHIFGQMLAQRGGSFLDRELFNRAIENQAPGLEDGRGLGFHLKNGNPSSCGERFCVGSYGHNGFTGTSLFVEKELGLYVSMLTNRCHYTRECSVFDLRRAISNEAFDVYTKA